MTMVPLRRTAFRPGDARVGCLARGVYRWERVVKAGGKQRAKEVTPGGIGRHKQSQHAVGTNGVVGEIKQYWGRDEIRARRGTGYAVGQPQEPDRSGYPAKPCIIVGVAGRDRNGIVGRELSCGIQIEDSDRAVA